MMTDQARYRVQMFGAYCGVAYIVVLLIGLAVFARFLPPHHPSASADEIAAIFREGATHIRVGMIFLMVGAAFCIPFTAMATHYVTRIEGHPGTLAYSVLMGGLAITVLTFLPAMFWFVACFRPDRAPEVIQAFNDWAWFEEIGGTAIWWPMPIAIAIAAFCDGSKDPVFPRWSGYAGMFLFFSILPDQLLFFFQTGPFAWNGLFGIWLPLGALGGWFLMISILMVRAMRRGIYPHSV